VILQIDVTVTGPDQVMTGSVAVDVTAPAADTPAPADQPARENLLVQMRSRALRWGGR
jgi:hypothetical protein